MICLRKGTVSAIGIATAACLLALSISAANAATTSRSSCQLNLATAKMKVLAVSGTTVNFGTVAFENLVDTTIAFTQGTMGCVVVQFSGDVESAPSRAILVRAVMRPVIASPTKISAPAQVTFGARDQTGVDAVSNAATFIFSNIAAGEQTLKIQWRGTDGGLPVYFGNRTLVVYFR